VADENGSCEIAFPDARSSLNFSHPFPAERREDRVRPEQSAGGVTSLTFLDDVNFWIVLTNVAEREKGRERERPGLCCSISLPRPECQIP
jgi:hypothetical protein